ncbi:MAG: tetratricopeptide repeat protein [Pseudomonadota bacterium]
MIRLVIMLLCIYIFSATAFAQNCPPDTLNSYKEKYIRPIYNIRETSPDEAIKNINILIQDTIPQLLIDCQNELLATSYNVRGLAEKYASAYFSSRTSFQQAMVTTNSNIEKGKFYSNACDLEKIIGNYDTAFLYCNTAIELLKEDSTAEQFLAKAYLNKANIFIEQDSIEMDIVELCINKVKELSPNEEDIKTLEYNYALALIRQDRYEDAHSLLNECYRYYTASNDKLNLARVAEAFGEINYSKGNFRKAKQYKVLPKGWTEKYNI